MELKNAQSDTLLNDIAIGATTATLTGGNFGTPTTAIYLTFDYDVAAKYEVKLATVAGANMTAMSHVSGADVAHTAGCKIGRMINVEVIDDILSGSARAPFANNAIPANALATNAILLGRTSVTSGNINDTTTPGDYDVAGLSKTVTVPAGGRDIEIVAYIPSVYTSAAAGTDFQMKIKEGSTVLQVAYLWVAAGNKPNVGQVIYQGTVTAGSHTYKVSLSQNAAGTMTIANAATYPMYISVKLI
jgi:hypothetical protein